MEWAFRVYNFGRDFTSSQLMFRNLSSRLWFPYSYIVLPHGDQ